MSSIISESGTAKLECCGYLNPLAVRWNEDNRAIQCHNCGHVWVPKRYGWRVQLGNWLRRR